MNNKLRSLLALADFPNAGLWLSLQKGWNELCHKRWRKPRLPAAPVETGYIPRVSVIICTCGRETLALRAVESVLAQTMEAGRYEVIVVENTAEPSTLREKLEALWQRTGSLVGYVREESPGISFARNAGARAARGEYLLYIDDDAAADCYLVKSMQQAFESHPEAGVIGGQIILDAPECGLVTDATKGYWSGYTVPYRAYRTVTEQYEFPYGACFGVRHSVLDAAGGFPETFGRTGDGFDGGEDTALCFMVQAMGCQIGIQPRARVTHHVEASRFTGEHIRQTIAAGLRTTWRLSRLGFTSARWTDKYIKIRIKIADRELKRLAGRGADQLTLCCKQWEREALQSLLHHLQ